MVATSCSAPDDAGVEVALWGIGEAYVWVRRRKPRQIEVRRRPDMVDSISVTTGFTKSNENCEEYVYPQRRCQGLLYIL